MARMMGSASPSHPNGAIHMKAIQLHPMSVLLSALMLGTCLLVSAQGPPGSNIRVQGIPTPHEMVQIDSTASYAVPNGMFFVLTALGENLFSRNEIRLNVDGQTVLSSIQHSFSDPNVDGQVGLTMHAVPSGYTVSEGRVITLTNVVVTHVGRAWGYLVDAQ